MRLGWHLRKWWWCVIAWRWRQQLLFPRGEEDSIEEVCDSGRDGDQPKNPEITDHHNQADNLVSRLDENDPLDTLGESGGREFVQ